MPVFLNSIRINAKCELVNAKGEHVNLTRIAVYRPVVILMILLIVALWGVVSFRSLGQDFLPQVSLPVVTVGIPYPGAGPLEVEEQVTRVVEDQISSLSNIEEMTSISRPGGASIIITFREGVDADKAASDVRQRVDTAKRELPAEILEPTVSKLNITELPVVTVALTSDRGTDVSLYRLADQVVRRELETIPGVGAVRLTGGRKQEVQVTVDPIALQARGIGVADVTAALSSQFRSAAVGQITSGSDLGAREMALRVDGRTTDLASLNDVAVRVPGAKSIRLAEVASVADGGADVDSLVRFNGRDAVGLLIFKQNDAQLTLVVERLRERLVELEPALPPGYQLEVVSDFAEQVSAGIRDVGVEFALAALITSLVLLMFLHRGRATLIVVLSIPTSLLVTVIAMSYFGLSLNIMSLLGLTTCIGILVDDSIVVIENIERWLARGTEAKQAAVQGRAEIGLAAVAITLVDVVVYGPVAIVGGATGEFLRNFALVIVVATLSSLVVSFTLTPLLASRWLSGDGKQSRLERLARFWEPLYDWIVARYRVVLEIPLRRPWIVVVTGVAVLVASVALVPSVGVEFVPDQNSGTVVVAGEMPGGTSLAATNLAAREWEQRLADRNAFPEVHSIFTVVGSGVTDADRGSRFFRLSLDIGPGAERSRTNAEIARSAVEVGRSIPGLRPVAGGGGPTSGVQVRMFATTLQDLTTAVEQARQSFSARPEFADVTVSGGTPSRVMTARIDQGRVREFGLSTDQVGLATRIAYQGVVATKLPRPDGSQLDVRVRLPEEWRRDASALERLPLVAGGQIVTLGQVARLEESETPSQINRINRQRVVTLSASPDGVPLGTATGIARSELVALELAPGVRWEFSGGSQQQEEAFTQLGLAIGAGILLAYAVLVILFGSFLQPFIVILGLPFALVGALIGLLVFGQTLNLLSLIGVLALFGLVGKNSILVVDYTNTLRARGYSRIEALREAAPTRLRAVLMTSLTLVLSLTPIALSVGEGGTIRAPLAAVIVGGMTTSTVLSLLFVPAIYVLLDDLPGLPARLFRRRIRQSPPAVATANPVGSS
jgi:hydrophobic/amphiphilic exporter-1 (mainly G- bacteria), HAE1 family